MNILYCSTTASLKTLDFVSKKLNYPLTSITVQKFHRMIMRGLVKNDIKVDAISAAPVCSKFNSLADDNEDEIRYHYLSTIELPIIRHLFIVIGVFLKTLKWHFSANKQRVAICDVLNISVCLGIVLSRLFGVKVIGLMTDMPGLMIGNKETLKGKIIKNVNLFVLRRFDAYIFLTEAMNDVINTSSKPYIIMEGLVDVDDTKELVRSKSEHKTIIYAGGIYEKYGLALLIDAFRNVKGDNLRLHIYGRIGDMPHEMSYYEELDPRFKYMGVQPNNEVVKAELSAYLLVNPRPTKEEFTKYSFPSKNMEYMVSGTPVLTMALPGMPKEYYPNLFVCYDETVDGLSNKIQEIMDMSDEELFNIGRKGRRYVLENKNNKIQGKRILELASML